MSPSTAIHSPRPGGCYAPAQISQHCVDARRVRRLAGGPTEGLGPGLNAHPFPVPQSGWTERRVSGEGLTGGGHCVPAAEGRRLAGRARGAARQVAVRAAAVPRYPLRRSHDDLRRHRPVQRHDDGAVLARHALPLLRRWVRHKVRAAGLGDVNLGPQAWLWDPRTHPSGNLAVVAGVKTPSGRHDVLDTWYIPGGSIEWTVDQSIQLGDGGWGVLFQTQGFRQASRRGYVYGFGSYLASPRNQTEILQAPPGRTRGRTSRCRTCFRCEAASGTRCGRDVVSPPALVRASTAFHFATCSARATGSGGRR
jgi:hypothetical protein